jgi:hypothetical protein
MNVYGLMITKDDERVFGDWCRDQLPLYDAVVCLDGSGSDGTARIAATFSGRLVYLHERDCAVAHKTDHGLRRIVHRELVRRFGVDNWVMCCHADEFCHHDPRKVAAKAEAGGYDLVAWYSLHFLPHPDDLPDWERLKCLPVPERVRYYHWDYAGSGLPWREYRLYRNGPWVCWDRQRHGSTAPHNDARPAPFHPILRHYKVFNTDLSWYAAQGEKTLFRTHWEGLEHRTGLAFPVHKMEDFFVRCYPNYGRCDRFDGRFDHPWNMGEEYRPDAGQPGLSSGSGF